MSTILTSTQRTAKKRHQCWYCGQSIDVGAKYEYRTGVFEGDFWTMHAHPECDAYAAENWDYDDYESHEIGEFERPMTAFGPAI